MKNNIADTKYNVYGNEAIQLLPTNPYANGWVDCRKTRAKMTAEELDKERIACNKRKWRRQLNMHKANSL